MHAEIVGIYSREYAMDREEYLRKCSNMKCQRVRICYYFHTFKLIDHIANVVK